MQTMLNSTHCGRRKKNKLFVPSDMIENTKLPDIYKSPPTLQNRGAFLFSFYFLFCGFMLTPRLISP